MLDVKSLLPDLKRLVRELAEDLLARSTAKDDPYSAKVDCGLREAYAQIEKGGRTADAFEVWRDDYLEQVAVAWVLACVFVRFMEDNHLIDECWLAGEGERRRLAEDTHELFFRKNPHDSDREYFQHAFREVGQIPAAKDLFAEGKTPLWAVAPSGDAAMKLLKFWREIDAESGYLKRSFQVESGDTRFLGDLYQQLSEKAQKKYALLQTPVFVEEFILDRTLTPALAEFGLEKVRMIDPTCGSGHFLLGGFARLFDLWSQRESNEIKAAQKALDGVWGVDINPFAVAIARFRLIVAAVQACGIKRLKQAPGWNIHLASGDSLLFGSKPSFGSQRIGIAQQLSLFEVPAIYAVEDRKELQEILGQGYHVVVGNPPYITVKDKNQNEAYRRNFPQACHRQYSLGVPFTQRFWQLAIQRDENDAVAAGHIGMITANSFMKREFGKKLIEEFFPKVDLTHVLDSSGAHIPGHGTPTVILFGRNQKPVSDAIRMVLKLKDEPTTPDDPALGEAWQSIVAQIDTSGATSRYTASTDVSREKLAVHPWSVGGGGIGDIFDTIEEAALCRLSDCGEVGIASWAGLDEVFAFDVGTMKRMQWPEEFLKNYITGDTVRDWALSPTEKIVAPYLADSKLAPESTLAPCLKSWWPSRSHLQSRVLIGGKTVLQTGAPFYSWVRFIGERYRKPYRVTFAFLSTHNHFVLDRGGSVFDRPAPVIMLRDEANEDAHLSVLGLLNSSIACLWLKQVMSAKGGGGIGRGIQDEQWEMRYDISVTQLESFPIPTGKPLELSRLLDSLACSFLEVQPDSICSRTSGLPESIITSRNVGAAIRHKMIALQEELDWQCYQLYNLLPDDLRYPGGDLPELALGQRAFEIVMARLMAKGELETAWFERHGSKPITEVPSHWPAAYRKLVERRIKLIETNKEIARIERPEYKRRWNTEPWEEQRQRALKNWLLDQLETQKYRKGTKDHPELTTTAQMADVASADAEFQQVAALYRGRPDFDVAALVAELVEAEAVPQLPILRYKPVGLRKREVWERTWHLQRLQDAGEDVSDIPVPPKYASADFLKTDYWRLRGKLDVPKERWVSYPHCQTESDPSLVVGWAGWNHLQQATALIAYYDARKREGWDANRLAPLLAGLDQLLPWIHQWHPEIDPEFGETAGQSYETLVKADAHELGLTLEQIRAWEPPAKSKGKQPRKARTKRKKSAEELEPSEESE